MDCNLPGSPVHRILHARILEWIAVPSLGDLPDPGTESASSALVCVWVCVSVYVLVAQLCPTLCNPIDFSLLGSSVHGILQAKVLESTASSFSRASFWTRDQTLVSHIAGRFCPIWATREALPALLGEFFTTSTNWKALNSQSSLEKERQTWRHHISWCKAVYKL